MKPRWRLIRVASQDSLLSKLSKYWETRWKGWSITRLFTMRTDTLTSVRILSKHTDKFPANTVQCSPLIQIQIKRHQNSIITWKSTTTPVDSITTKLWSNARKNTAKQEKSSGQSPHCLRTTLRRYNTALGLTNYSYTNKGKSHHLVGKTTTKKVCWNAFWSSTRDDTVSHNKTTTENKRFGETY